jgi:YD repeat-containing protein
LGGLRFAEARGGQTMKDGHCPTLVVFVLAAVFAFLFSATAAHAAATIQIMSPRDQSFVNPTGGPPDLVEVTYQVTGNTCTGFKSSFSIVPYVNGVAVSCGGSGCGCDGTTESCNNVTKTITLDGNSFNSCLNTIQLSMNPAPYTPPLCITPGSAIFSNTVQVWQDPYKTCTGPGDCNKSTVGRPVDVATGKMFHEMTDLRIQGPLPIEFTRRYDSQSTFNGAMGFGWQHAYQMRIEPAGTNRQVFVDRTGRRIYFAKNGQGAWQENFIEHLTLEAPGSPAWRVTDKHQTKYEFDGGGKLTRIADRNNNQITFGYTGSNLTSITDTVGRAMTLAYDGSNRLQTLSAGGRTVTYT